MLKNFFNICFVSYKIAYSEVMVKYRRSILGPFWISINMFVTIFALGYVFSSLFSMQVKDYIPYVFCGLLSWNFISTVIQDSVLLYINGAIKNYNFPVIFFPMKNVFKNLIFFLHNFLIYFLVLLINNDIFNYYFILFFISIPIYILNGALISFYLGVFCLKYRDIGQIVVNSLYLVFLVTPVFWDPVILSGKKEFILDFNPVYHTISIMRLPLLGQIPSTFNYLVVFFVTIINLFLSYLVLKNFNNNKAFWI